MIILAATGLAAAQSLRAVTIGLSSTSFGTAPVRAAKDMGLFAKHGLEPTFTVFDSGSVASAALLSGAVNLVLSGVVDAIVGQARGQNIVVVYTTYAGQSGTLVLDRAAADRLGAAPGASITARLKALDGLVIGAPSAVSTLTTAYRTSAAAAGANIRFIYMSQSAMGAALERGAVAGFVSSAPFWAAPIASGKGVLWISGPAGDLPPEKMPLTSGSMLAMRPFVDANPDIVRSVRAVLDEFATMIETRPDEIKAAVGKLYPALDAATLDLLFKSEPKAWKGPRLTVQDIAREIEFLKSAGVPMPDTGRIDPAAVIAP